MENALEIMQAKQRMLENQIYDLSNPAEYKALAKNGVNIPRDASEQLLLARPQV